MDWVECIYVSLVIQQIVIYHNVYTQIVELVLFLYQKIIYESSNAVFPSHGVIQSH